MGVEMNHLGEVFPGSRLELHQLLRQQNYAYLGTIRKIKHILSDYGHYQFWRPSRHLRGT